MLALIDYGAGNLTSVRKALAAIGVEVYTPSAPQDLARAAGVIVPGVGHFGATSALDERWRAALRASVRARRPLLGICLGMQWLFEGSDEAPELPGLGLLKGRCQQLGLAWQPPSDVEIQDRSKWKVPHIGWNTLSPAQPSRLLSGRPPTNDAYFAHSYAAPISTDCVATTTHGVVFSSMVERDDVYGVQFHPEKSSDAGLAVLRNFVRRTRGEEVPPLVVTGWSSAGPPKRLREGGLTARRVIACLDVRNGGVVKGTRFADLREAGDPASLARRYNAEGIDELVILDITATLEDRRALADTVRAVARELFIPLTVGGGIRSEADAAAAIEAGADKVSVNTAALADPSLLTRLAAQYGSQAVVVAIDAKRERGGFSVYSRSGTAATSRDAIGWAREATDAGAGEILLTSMDRDGTRAGFDCEMTAAISRAVPIPVIASGGAGEPEHFVEVFTAGRADAALAASIFHYRERGIGDLKRLLASHGIPVRQVESAR